MPLLQPSFRGRLAAVLRGHRDRADDRRGDRAVPAARRVGFVAAGLAAERGADRRAGAVRAGAAGCGEGGDGRRERRQALATAIKDKSAEPCGRAWTRWPSGSGPSGSRLHGRRDSGRSRPGARRRSRRRWRRCRTPPGARSGGSPSRRRARRSTRRRSSASSRSTRASTRAATWWPRRCPGAADAQLCRTRRARGHDRRRRRTGRRRSGREPRTGRPVVVRLLALVPARGLTGATAAVIGLTLGFLVLAFVFAVIVSRTLSAEVQRLLHAAQRLGRGDFSVTVPAEGNDEFAALGKEFNSMARQLEARVRGPAARAGAAAGLDPARRRVVRPRARPPRRAGDRRADRGGRRRRGGRARDDALQARRAARGDHAHRRPGRLRARAARRRARR